MEEKNDIVSIELDSLEWKVNEDKKIMWGKDHKNTRSDKSNSNRPKTEPMG